MRVGPLDRYSLDSSLSLKRQQMKNKMASIVLKMNGEVAERLEMTPRSSIVIDSLVDC